MFNMDIDSQRYEIKMVFENSHRFAVESWVRLHSRAFRTAFPTRRVNNLYFDTHSQDMFNDHIAGTFERRKLRFRWYGENFSPAFGQLELKHKQGMIGWKDSQMILKSLDFARCGWQEIYADLQSEATGVFSEALVISRPILINNYQRQYFISADGMIRLTLDYDLTAFDQSASPRPNTSFPIPTRDLLIIEFKAAPELARDLADVLAEFPLPVEAYSKYVELAGWIFQ
ncbi:hypothetical protein ADN00_16540 [Ornatilinea apprima]|uniref:VTC domain-containing protein n=1 Tax=Ornatilinea apprima TaxID=1134406 RepID=A0A0P6WZ79_9CHLR|nr:polyphosphate polymerase domain-containing protein [Ornatilinea apprima]KPL72080.1 hypothetical protein ADN00_16540 [Ornatilinea apprima]